MIDVDATKARLGSISERSMLRLPDAVRKLLEQDLPALLAEVKRLENKVRIMIADMGPG